MNIVYTGRKWSNFPHFALKGLLLSIIVLLTVTNFEVGQGSTSSVEPYVRVNWTYNTIEGKTLDTNMEVAVTILDNEDKEKGACTGYSDGDRDFYFGCGVDIVIGDIVLVDIGGDLNEIGVINMTGDVDSVSSTISGWIDVEYEAQIYGEVWSVEVPSPTAYGWTDEDGNYTLDFSPWDVKQGDYLVLYYIQQDGNQVGFVRNDLDVGVDVSKNRVWGDTTPFFEVEITVSDALRTKGSGITYANKDGFYFIDSIGDKVDILPGDTVEVTANDVTAIVQVPNPFNVSLDPENTRIYGEGPPNDTYMWVEVNGIYCDQVPIDMDGYWATNSINCPDLDLVGLEEDDRGVVGFVTEEAHQVILWFPSPEIVSIIAPYDPVQMINGEAVISASASFTYPIADVTFTADWFWGDENTTYLEEVTSLVFADYTYTEPGVYELKLIVTDSEGVADTEKFQYVVIYNPDGGFVTGGGWIDSPGGAYAPDPTLSGKASFGFVSKYKKGTTVPTGNTEFQFKAGDLNFHSSSYDWLVVTGSDYARFKGIGTINGEGDYKFMVWAGDGNGSGGEDTFRIKISSEDNGDGIIYDNGLDQEIGGGNIVVHKAK